MSAPVEEALKASRARVSVIIVTFRRPDHVRSCLQHLARLDPLPDEVIIIDASADELTSTVVRDFPLVRCIRFPQGAGHMTTSRNIGLLHATGDIMAFVDDDADVREGWLHGLLEAFADKSVGAVAGRTCNGLPGEESDGVEAIGRVLPNGELTGNFAADPGCIVDVDHGIGANMAFRRQALARLGGFRDDFRGIGGVREDTDVFLRVRALGYRAVFSPASVVDHVGAPHAKGRRFDYRYVFWARHNHALLLARNFGIGSTQFRRWLVSELDTAIRVRHPNPLRRGVRIMMGIAGVLAGLATSVCRGQWRVTDVVRRDRTGTEISRHLTSPRINDPNGHAP